MTGKRTSSYRGGSYQKSSYHPYRSNGGHGHASNSSRHYSSSSSSNRLISVNEALKTDRILSIESFANVERIKDSEVSEEYYAYVKKHQKAHLRNLFNRHKKEKWFQNVIENGSIGNNDKSIFDSLKWTAETNLQYLDEFKMQLEESVVDFNFKSGTETRILSFENQTGISNIPLSFESLLPEFTEQIITMSNIPPYVDRVALESHLKEFAPASKLEITVPNAEKSFYRLAWLQLEDNSIEKINELVPKLESLGSIEGAKVYFGIASSGFRRFKVTNYLEGSEDELFSLALKLITLFDKEFDESTFNQSNETLTKTELLDKAVIYLRKVHNFCFFCVSKFSCCQELISKCGDLHLRKVKNEFADENSKHDQNRLVQRLSALIDFSKNLKEISNEPIDSLDEALTESSVKKVEEGKYRCVHCSKAFKGPEFVLKHLTLKHEDVVQQTQGELNDFKGLLNNAPLWLFSSVMIPRYTNIRSKSKYNSNTRENSRKPSLSSTSRRSQDYVDLDAIKNSSTEISYDL